MTISSLHPCVVGDLPTWVQFSACSHLLPIDEKNIQSNWKTRYPNFIDRRKVGGLWVDVKKCDQWLDERGSRLLSHMLLVEKRRRNPGWCPAGDRLEALASAHLQMIDKLAELVALKLHAQSTGGAA